MHGARLVALSRDRYWLSEQGLRLDSGTIVAALEYAAGAESVLCGKPSATFYEAALGALGDGLAPAEMLMVGDDLWGDIQGAQRLGFPTCLVRTGKFREDVFRASGVRPDFVVDSVADVPALVTAG
jgi:ribonucleotide monophosphatase NagD (HAD superfamily)